MSISGMDVEAVRSLAYQLDDTAGRLDALGADLSASLYGVQWEGADATAARGDWEAFHGPLLNTAAIHLREGAQALYRQADEQLKVSEAGTDAGGASASASRPPTPGRPAAGAAGTGGGGGGSLIEQPALDVLGAVAAIGITTSAIRGDRSERRGARSEQNPLRSSRGSASSSDAYPTQLSGDRREDRRIRNDRLTRTPPGGRGGGSLNSDWAGRAILDRYLSGGQDWTISNDPQWNEYMMNNQALNDNLLLRAESLALDLFRARGGGEGSGTFDDTFAVEIQNGEGVTGYEYLHGTNMDAGGFNMRGAASISAVAGGYEVVIDAMYTWNDAIDPNQQYVTDRVKSGFAELITGGRADPYDIHISWPGRTVVRLAQDGSVVSVVGYPGDRG